MTTAPWQTRTRQTLTRERRRGDWMRAAALIGIACLLFNALVASSHDLRMAAKASGLGQTVSICTPAGAATVSATILPGGDPGRDMPDGAPGWHCPYCTFAKIAGTFLVPDAQAGVRPAGAARMTTPTPESLRLAARTPDPKARPRAPPVSV